MPVETGARGWKRIVWKVVAVAALLAIYGGLVTIAYVRSTRALSCINDALGERGAQGQAYDRAVGDVFNVIYLEGKGQMSQADAQKRFLKDATTVRHVTAYRNSHPLGRC